MPELRIASPTDVGFDAAQLDRLFGLLEEWAQKGRMPAAGVCMGRKGRIVEPRLIGRQGPEPGAPPLRKDAQFLIASITKPVTVTAVLMLLERGLLTLEDRVARFVPRFTGQGKEEIQVRHLMTHTSGLPDMLPNNDQLRAAHRPLNAFVDEICKLPLGFPPGTRVQYQSMGTAMLGEIVHQVTGTALPEFLRKEIFEPLGMKDTFLGSAPTERIARIRVKPEQEKLDWNWNSPYWLGFGAPWGGLVTTPADFARFCVMMLEGGRFGDVRILSPAAVRAMTLNQLQGMPAIPEEERRCRPWGLGWRLNWPAHSANFGDLLGPNAFGHWGATGTLCWMDPDTESFLVLFTTQPQEPEGRLLARISNMVSAALLPPLEG